MSTEKHYEMPAERACEELGLPHTLVCRRGQILASKIGISEREFDGTIAATLPYTLLGKRRRYYTAAVIRAFVGG